MMGDKRGAESHRVQRWKTAATAVLVVVLLSPAIRNGDGVPLSSYPMYAIPRDDVLEFVVPVGVSRDGRNESLSPRIIAATNDPLIAETLLRREVAAGRGALLCEQISSRIEDDAIVRVEVRIERHDVVERIRGRDSLIEIGSVVSCPA